MNRIRIVTINLAGINFDWFEKRRQVLIGQLQELEPDVIFLQETTIVVENNYDQSLDIAGETGLTSVAFAPYGNIREFESPKLGGVAILSKYPFTYVQNRRLPPAQRDEYGARVGLMVKIEKTGNDIILATTHLSWRTDESELRFAQVTEFLKLISSAGSLPVIIGGDFNCTTDEPAVRKILQSYKDTFFDLHPKNDGITWCSKNNYIRSRKDRRIDYIFCSHDLRVERAEVVLNHKQPIFPSDHFGVLTDLILL
ncbi:MAG: endonuclease/exonuclease/phosphatase family protein [Bacteriovoracia bacterium]